MSDQYGTILIINNKFWMYQMIALRPLKLCKQKWIKNWKQRSFGRQFYRCALVIYASRRINFCVNKKYQKITETEAQVTSSNAKIDEVLNLTPCW